MILNIEDLLKVATKVEELLPKSEVKQQKPFEKIIVLTAKVYKKGTARISIGKYKPNVDSKVPYCHYCVTRWSIRKHGSVNKNKHH